MIYLIGIKHYWIQVFRYMIMSVFTYIIMARKLGDIMHKLEPKVTGTKILDIDTDNSKKTPKQAIGVTARCYLIKKLKYFKISK